MQVFLSYSTTDLKQTLEIRDYLESNQISCWIAKRNIPGGTDYAIEIPKAIDQCDFFLLILTASSQKSQFVRNELEWAIKKNKKIIPFMLHEFNLDRPIEFHLQHHQRINVYEVGDVSAKKSLLQILQSTSYVTNTQNILQTNSELNSTDSQNNHPLIKNHHPPKFTQEHPRHGASPRVPSM